MMLRKLHGTQGHQAGEFITCTCGRLKLTLWQAAVLERMFICHTPTAPTQTHLSHSRLGAALPSQAGICNDHQQVTRLDNVPSWPALAHPMLQSWPAVGSKMQSQECTQGVKYGPSEGSGAPVKIVVQAIVLLHSNLFVLLTAHQHTTMHTAIAVGPFAWPLVKLTT